MTIKDKSRKLYMECNTDPKQSILVPHTYFDNTRGGIYHSLFFGMIVNKYATETFDDDFIPVRRETFLIKRDDREGWKSIERIIYRYNKKGLIETFERGSEKFIRLNTDDLYNPDLYRRK